MILLIYPALFFTVHMAPAQTPTLDLRQEGNVWPMLHRLTEERTRIQARVT